MKTNTPTAILFPPGFTDEQKQKAAQLVANYGTDEIRQAAEHAYGAALGAGKTRTFLASRLPPEAMAAIDASVAGRVIADIVAQEAAVIDGAIFAAVFLKEARHIDLDELLERAHKDWLPGGGFLLYWDDEPLLRVTLLHDMRFDENLLHGPRYKFELLLNEEIAAKGGAQ